MFDLEDVEGVAFDGFGDGVAVGVAGEEGLEDEEIEGALEEFDFGVGNSGRHSRDRVWVSQ